jgi:hypothetical protein
MSIVTELCVSWLLTHVTLNRNVHSTNNIAIRMLKSSRMKWVGNVASIQKHLNEEKLDGRVLTGITWHRTCTRGRIL